MNANLVPPPKIGVVADDLTGCCDSGIEFAVCSHSVLVAVETVPKQSVPSENDIFVHNTQSRNLPPEAAYHRTFEATQQAISAGARLIFKKVDSALRGNFGVEIAAVLDATGASLAVIMPAIPDAGRRTIGGVQYIDGVPIAEGPYAADPEHPVQESSVAARAEDGSGRKAGLVSLDQVRQGRAAEAAMTLQDQGHHIAVVDARTVADLHQAVKSLLRVRQRPVFVGCQGLAQALAARFPSLREIPSSLQPRHGRPTFLIFGSPHPQARRQLDFAAKSGDVLLVEIETSRVGGPSASGYLYEMTESSRVKLLAGNNVAICLQTGDSPIVSAPHPPLLTFLSRLARRILEDVSPAILMLTGGETAYAVCRALNVQLLKLHARFAPLVVASQVVGGDHHGLYIVTKGGSIGDDDLIVKIHQALRKKD